MKYLIFTALFSSFFFAGDDSIVSNIPNFDKKIERLVKKQWKGIKIVFKEAALTEDVGSAFQERKIFHLTSEDSLVGFLAVNKAYGCHYGGCQDVMSVTDRAIDNTYETFFYAIIFNPDLTIKSVKVLQYESEFGYEICGSRWLRQFVGATGCDLQFGKEIDGISGATVSAQSITYDISSLCWIMSDLKDELLSSR
jgi:hypothetical protein